MPEPLVLEAVTKRYGQGLPVVAGLSHTFAPGTATGLVGPNGSGKTTLLRLLAVVSFPTSGRVRYGDLDVHAHPHRYLRHVGIAYDTPALPQYLSAVELLEWILRARGRWGEDGPARVADLLDRLRLDERRENLLGTYSSGMLQKAQLAAALVAEPSVLLLDEPFRGLDAPSTDVALGLLREHTARGGLIVVASHLAPTLSAVCDGYLDLGQPLVTTTPKA